jgi:hypothetical protein
MVTLLTPSTIVGTFFDVAVHLLSLRPTFGLGVASGTHSSTGQLAVWGPFPITSFALEVYNLDSHRPYLCNTTTAG